MSQVLLLSFTSAFNPTLIAVTTVILLLPNPKPLMIGYLAGAMVTSVTLGLLIVFAFGKSGAVNTTKQTLSPAADLVLGGLFLALAFVLGSGRDQRIGAWRERRHEHKHKGPPSWQRALDKGTARATVVLGAALTLPGASYLIALHDLRKLNYATATTVLIVIAFNVVMLVLIEVPLVGFTVAPQRTPAAIDRAKRWVARHWHRFAFRGLLIIGAALSVKGLIFLIS